MDDPEVKRIRRQKASPSESVDDALTRRKLTAIPRDQPDRSVSGGYDPVSLTGPAKPTAEQSADLSAHRLEPVTDALANPISEEDANPSTRRLEPVTDAIAQGTAAIPGTRRVSDGTTRRGSRKKQSSPLPTDAFRVATRLLRRSGKGAPAWSWLALGLGAALLGQIGSLLVFHQAGTFNGAMLFALCASGGFIFPAFERNASAIWTRQQTPAQANATLAVQLGCLFIGLTLGFLLMTLCLGPERYVDWFRGAEGIVDAGRITLAGLGFNDVYSITWHNVRVWMVFFLVGVLFRYLGVLFVIIYNGAQWAVVLAAALMGSLASEDATVASSIVGAFLISPHMLLEMGAYVLAAMAGVFSGRALVTYKIGSEAMTRIGLWVFKLVALGLVIVALGALLESGVSVAFEVLFPLDDHIHPHG